MIKLIILLVVGYFLYKAVTPGSAKRPLSENPMTGEKDLQVDDDMVQDPICLTFVPKREALSLDRGEKRYYFCGPQCRDAFIDRETNTE